MDVSKTPILLIIFNRPDLTQSVLSSINQVKPKQLFVAADGPRAHVSGEHALCNQTRELVAAAIDWECELKTLYRSENLGCKLAVSGAINWFFEQVEQGIILEDDCYPDPSFFSFSSELLERYRLDERIMHISGNNFQISQIGESSYYLSRIPHIWGWASWRRAWQKYDVKLSSFDEDAAYSFFDDEEINLFWKSILTKVKRGEIDTWDYQWTYTLMRNGGYAIQPQLNLVKNIGFDSRASRTKNQMDFNANMKTYSLDNIQHITEMHYHAYADIQFQRMFGWVEPNYVKRLPLKVLLKALFQKLVDKVAS